MNVALLSGRSWGSSSGSCCSLPFPAMDRLGQGAPPLHRYFQLRDLPDATSPTGKRYRFTGYRLLDHFITGPEGDALLAFEANSSLHVLWNTLQATPGPDDGPPKTVTFDPDPSQEAYDVDFPQASLTVFGEWERLPMGGLPLSPGHYRCQILLTEESFHAWPGGAYTGGWAAAMGKEVRFHIR